MQLLFGLASLILLIPILYFLPLGLTGKGKVVIALISAFFALGAVYASELVPLWQSALLVIAIAGGTSLVFASKLGSFLFTAEEGMSVMGSFQGEKENDLHVLDENEPLEPLATVVVPKAHTEIELAEPVQEEIQDTELHAFVEADDSEEIGLLENIEPSLPVLDSVDFELSADQPESKEEANFLDELDMFQDIEELLEKSVPASPFAGGADSPFEERDLEILIHSDDEELPVLDFSKKESSQYQEQDDYLTALLETAATVEEEKAGGSGNV